MLKKELRLIITFRDTVMAIRMEKAMKEAGLPGRIIPLPSAISAGCGLCFMAPLEAREVLEQEMKRQDIIWELITELML